MQHCHQNAQWNILFLLVAFLVLAAKMCANFSLKHTTITRKQISSACSRWKSRIGLPRTQKSLLETTCRRISSIFEETPSGTNRGASSRTHTPTRWLLHMVWCALNDRNHLLFCWERFQYMQQQLRGKITIDTVGTGGWTWNFLTRGRRSFLACFLRMVHGIVVPALEVEDRWWDRLASMWFADVLLFGLWAFVSPLYLTSKFGIGSLGDFCGYDLDILIFFSSLQHSMDCSVFGMWGFFLDTISDLVGRLRSPGPRGWLFMGWDGYLPFCSFSSSISAEYPNELCLYYIHFKRGLYIAAR